MNKDLLLEIADAIEAYPDKFNLNYFIFAPALNDETPTTPQMFHGQCRTTACVAGWACVIGDGKWNSTDDIEAEAQHLLDLTDAEGHALFFASGDSIWSRLADEYGWETNVWGYVMDWTEITAYQAADVLKRIAKEDVTL